MAVALCAMLAACGQASDANGNNVTDARIESGVDNDASSDTAEAQVDDSEPAAEADTFSEHERKLIAQAEAAWAAYRGDTGEASEEAYDQHTILLDKLFARGICWGRVNDIQAEYTYHWCGPDSIHGSDEDLCNRGDQAACLRS